MKINNKSVLIILLISATVFLGGCVKNNEIKFDNCKKTCQENSICTKRLETKTFGLGSCAENNIGDCVNICIQKYK